MQGSTKSGSARRATWALTAVMALTALAGCGKAAEKIAERGLEEAIENESGGEVDIDLGGGGFNLETEDGSIRVGDDGSFVIQGEDGQVITGNADEGGFNAQSQDGDDVFRIGGEIPAEWPADIPRPAGLTDIQGSFTSGNGFMLITVVGTPTSTAAEYAQAYAASLEGLGYERASFFEGSGNTSYVFDGPMYNVTIFGNDNASPQVSVSVSPLAE